MTPTRRILLGVGVAAPLAVAAAVVFASGLLAGQRSVPSAAPEFSALGSGTAAPLSPQLRDPTHPAADPASVRTTLTGLGRYASQIQLYSARSGALICYALLGSRGTDPAQSYCLEPKAADAPGALRGLHFNAIAPYSAMDGMPLVQLAGIAFDDVRSMRARVGAGWRPLEVQRNSFYLEIPGASVETPVEVEATLADGTIQSLRVR